MSQKIVLATVCPGGGEASRGFMDVESRLQILERSVKPIIEGIVQCSSVGSPARWFKGALVITTFREFSKRGSIATGIEESLR